MKENVLASRYAKALFRLADDSGDPERLVEPLRAFASAVVGTDELARFWSSPQVRTAEKEKLMQTICDGADVPDEIRQLARLLARKRRIGLLEGISFNYNRDVESAGGTLEVDIVSARELDKSMQESVCEALQEWIGRKIRCDVSVDPELIAGLRVQIGDKVIDQSLAGRLARFGRA